VNSLHHSLSSSTALVTGASGGIGKELARLCAQDGMNVVLIARSKSALHELATELEAKYKITAIVLVKDLSLPNAANDIFNEIVARNISVDVLINNAGFGLVGAFSDCSFDDTLKLISVNIVALTELTRCFLPSMIERRKGKILNIASTAAFLPGPFMAIYYASKAYVLSLSEALSEELKGTTISVTALCPGPTLTGFIKSAHAEKLNLFNRGSLSKMTAGPVALIGYRAMQQGRRTVIAGWYNNIMLFFIAFVPKSILLKISRYLNTN
jgi:short-subunit dehydrogenase